MFIHIRLKPAFSLLCAGLLVLLTAAVLPAALRGRADDAPEKDTPDATVTDADPVEAPILMYHSVCVNDKVHSDYYISPERLEGDLKYLRDHGYTTVFISEIADYAEELVGDYDPLYAGEVKAQGSVSCYRRRCGGAIKARHV